MDELDTMTALTSALAIGTEPMNETLGEALPKEIERCQELLAEYRKIPPASGAFAAAMIEQDIKNAHKAMIEQDLPTMIRVYEALKGWQ